MEKKQQMTSLSKAGIALARTIGQTYMETPDAAAAMIGGSVARGCADEFSDVEIGVFWRRAPSEAERREAVAAMGGRIETFDRTPGHEFVALDHITIGGVGYTGSALISIHHLTVEETEAVIEDVLGRLDTDLRKQALMAALETGIKRAVTLPSLNAWSELLHLIQETIALVETHLPEVNTMSLFPSHPEVNTEWARRRWVASEPYSLLREIISGIA